MFDIGILEFTIKQHTLPISVREEDVASTIKDRTSG